MARKFKILQDFGIRAPFVNSATALHEGEMVVFSSNTLAEIADTCTTGCVGITCTDIAASATGWVYTDGIFEGTAAATMNFAIGDEVYAASASTLDSGTAGDRPVGIVVAPDPATAGAVAFQLLSIVRNPEIAVKS